MTRYVAENGVILADGALLRYADDSRRADGALRSMLTTGIVEHEIMRIATARHPANAVAIVMYLGAPENVLSDYGLRTLDDQFTQATELRSRFNFCWRAIVQEGLKPVTVCRGPLKDAPTGIFLAATKYKVQFKRSLR